MSLRDNVSSLINNIGSSVKSGLSSVYSQVPSDRIRVRSSGPSIPKASFRETVSKRVTQGLSDFSQQRQQAQEKLKLKAADLARQFDRDKTTPGFQLLKPRETQYAKTALRGAFEATPLATPLRSFDIAKKYLPSKQDFKDIAKGFLQEEKRASESGQRQKFILDPKNLRGAIESGEYLQQRAPTPARVPLALGTEFIRNYERGFSELGEGVGDGDVRKLVSGAYKTVAPSVGLAGGVPAVLMNVGLGGGLSAAIAKFTGEDPIDAFAKGGIEGLKFSAVTRFTNPATDLVLNKIGGNLLQRQIGKRSVAALANIIEDEIIAGLDNVDTNTQSRIYSAIFGALFGGNDDIIKAARNQLSDVGIKNVDQVVASVKNRLDQSIQNTGIVRVTVDTPQGPETHIIPRSDFNEAKADLDATGIRYDVEDMGNIGGYVDPRSAEARIESTKEKLGVAREEKITPEEYQKVITPETPKAEKIKILKDYAYKTMAESQTPQEAVANIRSLVDDARFRGETEDFQALKQAVKEYKKLIVTGPGMPRNPEYDELFNEVEDILATKIKDFQRAPVEEGVDQTGLPDSEVRELGSAEPEPELPSIQEQIRQEPPQATVTPAEAKAEAEALSPTGKAEDVVEATKPQTAQEILQEGLDKRLKESEQTQPDSKELPPEVNQKLEEVRDEVLGVEDIKEKYARKQPEKKTRVVVENPKNREQMSSDEVLDDLEAGFKQAEKFRGKEKDNSFSTMDKIRARILDRFRAAEVIDRNFFINLRLLAGGGDARTENIIGSMMGPVIAKEAQSQRLGDFEKLIALDRSKELVGQKGLNRRYSSEEIDSAIAAIEAKYSPEEVADMRASADNIREKLDVLLDAAVKNGLVSEDFANAAKAENNMYVAFETVNQVLRKAEGAGTGGGTFNVSKQEVLQGISDTESQIASPLISTILKMEKMISQMDKNSVLRDFVDRIGGPESPHAIPLRQADRVRERIRLSQEINELVPIKNKIIKLITTRNKWARQLNSEINKLNQEGLLTSLSRPAKTVPDSLFSKVDEKVTTPGGTVTTDTGDKFFVPDESRPIKRKLTQEYAVQKNRGEQATKRFIEGLIELPSSDIKRIQSKIGTRDANLNKLLEDIAKLSDEFNTVKDTIVDLRIKRGELKDITEVPDGYGVINTWRDGVKEEWAVPQEIEIAVKNLDVQPTNAAIKWFFAKPTEIFKKAVTQYNPAFIFGVNPVRDFSDAIFGKSTEKGLVQAGKLLTNYASGIQSVTKQNDLYDVWQLTGGAQSGFLGGELRTQPIKLVEKLGKTGDLKGKVRHLVKGTDSLIKEASRVTEEMTRLANFKTEVDKMDVEGIKSEGFIPFAELPKGAREAAFSSRNITLDFARMGTSMKTLNQIIPFLNVGVQGTARIASLAKDNPAGFVKSMMVLTFLPALAAYANNRQFDDYEDLREYEKQDNFIWIYKDRSPEEVEEKAPLYAFTLPLGNIQGPLHVISTHFLDFMGDTDRQGIDEFLKDTGLLGLQIAENLSPVGLPYDEDSFRRFSGNILPVIPKSLAQISMNKDFYTGMPIEPEWIQGIEREYVPSQYREGYYTGPTTRAIGRATGAIGLSPARMDNLISSTLGGTGKTVIAGTDTLLGSPPKDISRVPIAQRFFGPSGGQIADDERKAEIEETKESEMEGFEPVPIFEGQASAAEGIPATQITPELKIKTSDQVSEETEKKGWFSNLFGKKDKADEKIYDAGQLITENTDDRFDLYAMPKNATFKVPKEQEAFNGKYKEVAGFLDKYDDKVNELLFDDTTKQKDKEKKLKELDEQKAFYDAAFKVMEEKYPEQVFEGQLKTYGRGSDAGVEKRGDWAASQLSKLIGGDPEKIGTSDEWKNAVNKMWEAGVLTSGAGKTLEYILDNNPDLTKEDFKYTGDNERIKKAVNKSLGGKKFTPVRGKMPSAPEFKPISIRSSGGGSDFTPVDLSSISFRPNAVERPSMDYLKLKQPELVTPTVQTQKLKVKGL